MHAKRLAPEIKPMKPRFAIRTKIIASFCAFMLAASVTVTAIPSTTANADTYVMATSTVYLNVREYTAFYYNTSTERRCNHFIPGLFVSVICLLFEKIKCFFVLKTRDQVIF